MVRLPNARLKQKRGAGEALGHGGGLTQELGDLTPTFQGRERQLAFRRLSGPNPFFHHCSRVSHAF